MFTFKFNSILVSFGFNVICEQLWLSNFKVEDSTDGEFFHPINGSEHGFPPSLTTRERELVFVLEAIVMPIKEGLYEHIVRTYTPFEPAVLHSTNFNNDNFNSFL